MHAVLAKSTIKKAAPAATTPVVKKLNVIQKKASKSNQKPVKLAQVSSESEEELNLNMEAT